MNNSIITNLYATIKKRTEVRTLIPMGYVPGLPILAIKNECLVAIVPFLRYKMTGIKDRTLVFPTRYLMQFSLPDLTLTQYSDLAFEKNFSEVNFKKAIGFFRHDAVKGLDKESYLELRKAALLQYDKLCGMLINDAEYSDEDDLKLKKNLQILLEPSLHGMYKAIDADFFNKYIKG